MKVAAYAIDELMNHSQENIIEESNENGHIFHNYKLLLMLLRKILEHLATKKIYTRRWRTADVLILISPFCSCCDRGRNMVKAIHYVRRSGYSGKIIALFYAARTDLSKLSTLTELCQSDGKIICMDFRKKTALKEVFKLIKT